MSMVWHAGFTLFACCGAVGSGGGRGGGGRVGGGFFDTVGVTVVAHLLGVAALSLLPSFCASASVVALRFFPAAMVVLTPLVAFLIALQATALSLKEAAAVAADVAARVFPAAEAVDAVSGFASTLSGVRRCKLLVVAVFLP